MSHRSSNLFETQIATKAFKSDFSINNNIPVHHRSFASEQSSDHLLMSDRCHSCSLYGKASAGMTACNDCALFL